MTETVIGILASGRGSNAQAIIDAVRAGRIRGKAAVLISDNPQAPVLERAKEWGILVRCLDRQSYAGRADFEAALAAELDRHGVRLLLLAGFMRLLSPAFIHLYKGRIMNIHPSLLPSFPGLTPRSRPSTTAPGCLAAPSILWMTAWIRGRSFCRRPFPYMKMIRLTIWRPESWRWSIDYIPKRFACSAQAGCR